MSNLNNLSPQEQACVEQVQNAPKAQRQNIFEKACNAITDKTRITLLAATLSLAPPVLAQNTPHYVIDEISLTTLPQSAQVLKPTLANISKEQANLVKS
jgi:aspartate/glutamate racemase